MQKSFVFSILEEICPDFGIKIVMFPNKISGGYLVLPNGTRHYFINARWDVNSLGGNAVVNDKALTLDLLKESGYHVPKGILLEDFEPKSLEDLKFPIVIKPNSQAQARGLTYVENPDQAEKAFSYAYGFEKKVRAEEAVLGRHVSFSIFNNKIYSAHEREPFSSGNTIGECVEVLSEKVKEYITKIPQIFNLKLASIDCVYTGDDNFSDSEKFVIIEVNGAPSFKKYGESSNNARGVIKLLYKDMIEFILSEAK